MTSGIRLRRVPGRYGIARLPSGTPTPEWLCGAGFTTMIFADDETTIVCEADRIPEGIEVNVPWVCLRSIGPFEFQATGIVQSLIAPLSGEGIGVFVICTFDGEHILVAERDSGKAFTALTKAGHRFETDTQ